MKKRRSLLLRFFFVLCLALPGSGNTETIEVRWDPDSSAGIGSQVAERSPTLPASLTVLRVTRERITVGVRLADDLVAVTDLYRAPTDGARFVGAIPEVGLLLRGTWREDRLEVELVQR